MRKILFFVLFLALAVWLIACSSSSKKVVVQPQTSAFAFVQEAAGQSYMFTPMLGKYVTTGSSTVFTATSVMDPSTNQPVTAEFWSIVLSADGKKATFDLAGGLDGNSGQWDIWVANSDGTGNPVQVTNDSYDDAMPQFSPDGTKVVFTSYRPLLDGYDHYQIVIRNADGTGEQVLPMPPSADQTWAPTYSPDGTKIAVEAWGYDTSYFDGIFIMNADGSNAQMLTNPSSTGCDCLDETPAFTADGSKITFSRDTYDPSADTETEDIYIMNADGTGVTKLTDGVGINSDPLAFTIPGVGERILFSANRDNLTVTGSGGFDLYSMKTDGTGLTRLTVNSLFDAFSAEWYESGGAAAAARRARRFTPNYHPRNEIHNPAHKMRW